MKHNRYKLTPSSENPGWYVLADTENNIVVRWKEGFFNETQKVSVLDDAKIIEHTAGEMARIMREIGDYVVRYHGSICFDMTFVFEYDEQEDLYLCRTKYPKWRLHVTDQVPPEQLASTLRKAAEYLTKGK